MIILTIIILEIVMNTKYMEIIQKLENLKIVSVIKLRNKSKIFSKVKKGEIYKALILRTKHSVKKRGINISFDENYVCLINKQGKPISTRIFGPIPKELKKHKWVRLSSLSSGFL